MKDYLVKYLINGLWGGITIKAYNSAHAYDLGRQMFPQAQQIVVEEVK